jgi:hypothetical protein
MKFPIWYLMGIVSRFGGTPNQDFRVLSELGSLNSCRAADLDTEEAMTLIATIFHQARLLIQYLAGSFRLL